MSGSEQYYARFEVRPFGMWLLRLWPLIVLLAALYAKGVSITPRDDWSSFERGLLTSMALGGAVVLLAMVVAVMFMTARRFKKQPFLILDPDAVTVGGAKIHWNAVGEITMRRIDGSACIAINTKNDVAALQRLPRAVRLLAERRLRRIGAPFMIPPVRGMSVEDLARRLETYRARAIAPHPAAAPAQLPSPQ